MISAIQRLILPDYCCSCGQIGAIICPSCKYDIIQDIPTDCVSCRGIQSQSGVCNSCSLPYSRGWYVGERRDSLRFLVGASKFESNRAGCDAQAELLSAVLPVLPDNAVIVPVPTIAKHVRQRGFGHAERIARSLARLRGVSVESLIGRAEQHVQHGATRSQRKRQAERSYCLQRSIQKSTTYIIVDDVFTTGFTAYYVAKLLRDAGAQDVWLAVTSRQPIDEKG